MTNGILGELYQYTTPALIAVVGYFLRGILSTIKKIEGDFNKFQQEYAGHRVIMQEHRERIERIEEKLEQNDRDTKLFIMEYGPALKKIKND
jgi:hypothetical protein